VIAQAIRKQFKIAVARKWDRTYWAVDLHETLIRPNYRDDELPVDYYPHALEAMRMLSERPDVVLIMYTCSWPKEVEAYLQKFGADGIKFDYVNENPEVASEGYGCYDRKIYFNLLLDDKAGFDAETHWLDITRTLQDLPILAP